MNATQSSSLAMLHAAFLSILPTIEKVACPPFALIRKPVAAENLYPHSQEVPWGVEVTMLRLPILAAVFIAFLAAGRGAGSGPPLTDSHGDPLPPHAIARMGTARLRHGLFISSIAFAPDGKSLAVKADERVSIWDLATGKKSLELTGESGPSAGAPVTFSPDGRLVAFGDGKQTLLLCRASTGKVLRKFSNRGSCTSLAFSPDGKILALGGHGNPRARGDFGTQTTFLDTATGNELRRCTGHTARVSNLAFAPDGKTVVSAGYDHTIRIWEVASGRELRKLTGPSAHVQTIAFSPDGHTIASGDEKGNLCLWEAATGKEIRRLPIGEAIYDIDFSPDGKYLAVGTWWRPLIELWEVKTGKRVRQFGRMPNERRSTSICSCVAFSPDGKTLAGRSHHHCVDRN